MVFGGVDDNFCGNADDEELGGNADDGSVVVDPNSSSHLQQQLRGRRL